MPVRRTVLFLATSCAFSCGTCSGSAPDAGALEPMEPEAPFAAGLAPREEARPAASVAVVVNEGFTPSIVYRGQPVFFRATAALFQWDAGVPLPADSLRLIITRTDGGGSQWPLARLEPSATLTMLTADQPAASANWLTDETQQALGSYVARLSWGGYESETAFELQEYPASPTGQQTARFAVQRAEALISTGQSTRAAAVIDDALKLEPSSPLLLEKKALLLEAAGDLEGALEAVQAAIDQTQLLRADAGEPFSSAATLRSRLIAALLAREP